MSEAHKDRAHARLSASGASRWINCPASPQLEDLFPDEESEASAEGTLAHEFAELEQKKYLGLIEELEYNVGIERIKSNSIYSPEMDEYVNEYVEYVLAYYFEAQSKKISCEIFLEVKLNLGRYIPEGFGTSDGILRVGTTLHVFDLKYGFLRVEAFENVQLKVYGVGALIKMESSTDVPIEKVVLHIVQPRIRNFSSWETTPKDLFEWAESELVEFAEVAHSEGGFQKAGAHCQFCKAAHSCRELATEATEELQRAGELGDFELLDMDEKASLYLKLQSFRIWADSFEEHMERVAKSGVTFNGLKIVEGQSRRFITDETAVIKILEDTGADDELIYKKKLIPLGVIEKLFGKDLIKEYVVKPRGKQILVASSDKRAAFAPISAEEAFAEPLDDEE